MTRLLRVALVLGGAWGAACAPPPTSAPDGGLTFEGGHDAGPPGEKGPCGLPLGIDPEPNDASALTPDSSIQGCVHSAEDVDVYVFTAPASGPGGAVAVRVWETGPGAALLEVYAPDHGLLESEYASAAGQEVTLFFSAAPGQSYRLKVASFFGDPFAYRLSATAHPQPDAFEPNDAPEMAAALALGTPAEARVFAGSHAGGPVPAAAYDDWYEVSLSAGAATVTVAQVPADVALGLELRGPAGALVAQQPPGLAGQLVTLGPTAVAAGVHRVRVCVGAPPPSSGGGLGLPAHLTSTYSIRVTQ